MAEEKKLPVIKTGYETKEITIKTIVFQTDMDEAEAFDFIDLLSEIASEASFAYYDKHSKAQKRLDEGNPFDNDEFCARYYRDKWHKAMDLRDSFDKWKDEHIKWDKNYKEEEKEEEADD